MKAYLAIGVGLALFLAPLWTLSGFVTVPQYRTGTISDYATALVAGAALYGGVLVGVLAGRRYRDQRNRPVRFKAIFLAAMAGAMGAITLGLAVVFLSELASTGRLMPAGQTPALLPVFYIVGGILSALIAIGVGLIAYGLSGGASKGVEAD